MGSIEILISAICIAYTSISIPGYIHASVVATLIHLKTVLILTEDTD